MKAAANATVVKIMVVNTEMPLYVDNIETDSVPRNTTTYMNDITGKMLRKAKIPMKT
jgi:hypothetical protein